MEQKPPERPKTRAQELAEQKHQPTNRLPTDNDEDHGIELICAHCTATPPDWDIGMSEIRAMHIKRGFRREGYTELIRRNGDVEPGRPEGEELAHAKGYNENAVAICLAGGVRIEVEKDEDGGRVKKAIPEENFTEAQKESLSVRLAYYRSKYPNAKVCGHHDLPDVNKACPCFDVQHFLDTGEFEEKLG